MRRSECTGRQIPVALKQTGSGLPANDVGLQTGVSPATFRKWCARCGGLDAAALSRLRELEDENARLKHLIEGIADGINPGGSDSRFGLLDTPEQTRAQ